MESRLLIIFIIFSSSRPAGGQQVFDDFYPEEPDQISSKQGTILITEDHQHSITTPRLVEWFVLLGGQTDLHSSDFWDQDWDLTFYQTSLDRAMTSSGSDSIDLI